jgi:hypothetical protein
MDGIMFDLLESIGFDTQYAIQYYPANHRDMTGKTGVGFLATGEININRKHMKAVYTDTITRLAATSYTDRSLTQELAGMMNNTLDFNSFNDVGEEEDSNLFEDQLQPDYKYVAGQIKQLAEIRDSLRGPPMGADGSPATREEVATWYKLTLANQL